MNNSLIYFSIRLVVFNEKQMLDVWQWDMLLTKNILMGRSYISQL